METLRRLFSWQVSVLLLAGMAAGAQVNNSNQNGQSPGRPPEASAIPPSASEAPTTPQTISPGITVIGSTPAAEPALPKLPPDQFTDCYARSKTTGPEAMDFVAMEICEAQLAVDRRTVIEKCINRDGKNPPPVVIQACTELLDHKIFLGSDRFYVYANRAEAYLFQGDKQHALDDYNEAVKLAPHNAKLYYNRGVFYEAQTDGDAALRDFDAALGIDAKLVPVLRERAKIYVIRSNFSGALADCSEAIRLEPKTAALWSQRGYVYLRQHDYENAIKDETQAIQLDPNLARAYFFRGAAFGGRGDSPKAVSDLVTAVGLDPSLDRYVTTKGKNASLTLPPF
jgi:Flp pilus assembly protein TadD